MNKKELYESIMKAVSRQVKKTLNENVPFYQKTADGKKKLSYICTTEEKVDILSRYDGDRISDNFDYDDIDQYDGDVIYYAEVDEDIIMINGRRGSMSGTITYDFYYDRVNDEEYGSGFDLNHYEMDSYELTFYPDDSDDEITVYLDAKDAIQKEDYNSPVKRAYEQNKEVERIAKIRAEENERQMAWDIFVDKCKRDPESYLERARQYERQYESGKADYWILEKAIDIYNALAMRKDAERVRNIFNIEYDKEND